MKDYIDQHQERFLNELMELLRIPSVSADSNHKSDVSDAANFVLNKLKEAGADRVERHETAGHPVIFAEKIVDPNKPTILVYGHYDVQPPDPIELWESSPFDPVIKDGKIIARGASDDKGQMYMHVKAFEALNTLGDLPCNVKFLIEGEEEVGSHNLGPFVRNNKALLSADMLLVSDTGMISNDNPSITVGLRGMSYVEVEVEGPNRDLHSGMYGGAVANPINILCEMIASLHDKDNKVTVPGFYDDVEELSKDDRAAINSAPFSIDEYKDALKLSDIHGESGYSTLERIGIRPTLDVNGIWGGYTGEGSKTVIPSKAFAKISMRLVPHQGSEKITKLFETHFNAIAPPSVKVKVKYNHGAEPAVTPTDSVSYKAASVAMEQVWGKKPIPTREGGSIPIVQLFEEELKVSVLLMGFGLDEDAIHSPNESYGLENYYKGIETIGVFHKTYADLMNQ